MQIYAVWPLNKIFKQHVYFLDYICKDLWEIVLFMGEMPTYRVGIKNVKQQKYK